MAIALVTGASGFVGSHVVPELVAGGHRVVALVRDRASGDAVMARLDAEPGRERTVIRAIRSQHPADSANSSPAKILDNDPIAC